MNNNLLSSLEKQISIFDIVNSESSNDLNNPMLHNNENKILKTQTQNIIDIGIQTDSNWIDQIKKELLTNIHQELGSKSQKSKSGSIRSQLTRYSGLRSRRKADSILAEDIEKESIKLNESIESLPIYPESKLSDEYGINIYTSSEEEDGEIDYEKFSSMVRKDSEQPKVLPNQEEMEKAIQKNMIYDAGLPSILKVSKELGSDNRQIVLSVDTLLANSVTSKPEDTCEFCKKPLISIPSRKDQIESNVDQAKIFCCQEFRDLVDYALTHRQDELCSLRKMKEDCTLIDVSPHKSHNKSEKSTEDKIKFEKKIRDRLVEGQNMNITLNQPSEAKIDTPRRAFTEMPMVTTRQMKVINYQLSSFKFMKDGWTIRPPHITNDEISAKKEMEHLVVNMECSKLINEIFGQAGLSNQFSLVGVFRQYYPDGTLYMILFPNGSGSIYYPSGNLAISIICESINAPMICVIQDDSLSDGASQILGFVDTSGFGTFSHNTGEIKIFFDKLMGIQILKDGSRKRQWYWDGKPHVHAPPFQPLFLSINRYISVRISSYNGIFINFFTITRQIHINVGFVSEIDGVVQQKMRSMIKLETEKLTKPLSDIKKKIRLHIGKYHEAMGHPNLLVEKTWPNKSIKLEKLSPEKKTTLSLSLH